MKHYVAAVRDTHETTHLTRDQFTIKGSGLDKNEFLQRIFDTKQVVPHKDRESEFWIYVAEDADWNKHQNGNPISVQAYHFKFSPL